MTREQAERVFRLKESDITQEDIRCFQDYLFWKICEIAAEVSLPLQCHTGMGQVIDTNILQLNNVIKNNPETKFVLLCLHLISQSAAALRKVRSVLMLK